MSAARDLNHLEWPSRIRRRLSPVASEFLRTHPAEAELVVANALEEAAASESDAATARAALLPEVLRRFITRGEQPAGGRGLLNLSEASERLDITRSTLNAWIKAHRVIAWHITRHGVVVPGAQIIAPRKVLPGIAQVLEAIGDPVLAWEFLIEESPFLEPPQRPLDALKAGHIEAVARAARARGEAFT